MFYFTADTHHLMNIEKVINFEPLKLESDKKNKLFVLGDWGGLWFPYYEKNLKALELWNSLMIEKNFELFIIPGNHENYELINKLPNKTIKRKNDYFNAKILTLNKNNKVYILNNGIHYIDNKKILTIRGAFSRDKNQRTLGINYWEEELLSRKEKKEMFKLLENNKNKKFDLILSHTCPFDIIQYFNFEYVVLDPVSCFLNVIYNEYLKNKFNYWFFGHLHEDKIINHNNDNFIAIYNNIWRYE